jgi:hypothetical protein
LDQFLLARVNTVSWNFISFGAYYDSLSDRSEFIKFEPFGMGGKRSGELLQRLVLYVYGTYSVSSSFGDLLRKFTPKVSSNIV